MSAPRSWLRDALKIIPDWNVDALATRADPAERCPAR
jgi:hypothetical protein